MGKKKKYKHVLSKSLKTQTVMECAFLFRDALKNFNCSAPFKITLMYDPDRRTSRIKIKYDD